MKILWINNCAVHLGGSLRYKGELYSLENFGSWGLRIERGDCVLIVQPSEVQLP